MGVYIAASLGTTSHAELPPHDHLNCKLLCYASVQREAADHTGQLSQTACDWGSFMLPRFTSLLLHVINQWWPAPSIGSFLLHRSIF